MLGVYGSGKRTEEREGHATGGRGEGSPAVKGLAGTCRHGAPGCALRCAPPPRKSHKRRHDHCSAGAETDPPSPEASPRRLTGGEGEVINVWGHSRQ